MRSVNAKQELRLPPAPLLVVLSMPNEWDAFEKVFPFLSNEYQICSRGLQREEPTTRGSLLRSIVRTARFKVVTKQHDFATIRRIAGKLKSVGATPTIDNPKGEVEVFEFWFDVSSKSTPAFYFLHGTKQGKLVVSVYTERMGDDVVEMVRIVDDALAGLLRSSNTFWR